MTKIGFFVFTIQKSKCGNVYISLYVLLFDDDAAMFAESKEALQHNLNCLKSYYDEWSLTVNFEKTKERKLYMDIPR